MVLKYALYIDGELTWNVIGNVLAISVGEFDANDVIKKFDEDENFANNKVREEFSHKKIEMSVRDKIYYWLKHKDISHNNNELFINLPNFSICAIDDQYICGVKKVCAVIGNSLKDYEDNYCLQLICSNDVYLLDDNGNTVERL